MSFNYLVLLSYESLNELLVRALCALLMFVPVLVCCRLLGDRRPYLQLILWTLVVIRAALPSSFSLPFSLREVIAHYSPHSTEQLGFPLGCITESICSDALLLIPGIPVNIWTSTILLGWSGVTAWLLWRFFATRRQYRAALRAAEPASDPRLLQALQVWRTRFKIRRHVELRIGKADVSPFTMGILRPYVYLPKPLARRVDSAEMVIAHELAHIKRFDDVWVLICGLVGALYFFFPPIRYAIRQLGLQRERVCDQWVVSRGAIDPRHYAFHLLSACQNEASCSAVAGLSARATVYSSRLAAVAEAANIGIRGIPVALLVLGVTVLFLMPMRAHQSSLSLQQNALAAPAANLQRQPRFGLPVAGHEYGARHGEIIEIPLRGKRLHTGVDLLAPIGSKILAMADGIVEQHVLKAYGHASGRKSSYLVIRHGEYLAYYTYLRDLQVQPGDTVRRGQPLGRLDETSLTLPGKRAHLHLEIMLNGASIDPVPLFGGHATL